MQLFWKQFREMQKPEYSEDIYLSPQERALFAYVAGKREQKKLAKRKQKLANIISWYISHVRFVFIWIFRIFVLLSWYNERQWRQWSKYKK